METVLYIIIGIVIGIAVGYVIGRLALKGQSAEKLASVSSERDVLAAQIKMMKEDEEEEKQQHADALSDLRAQNADALEAQKQRFEQTISEMRTQHSAAIDVQKQRFDETLSLVTEQMKTATNEMLKQRQKEFAEKSNEDLGQIVNPLREIIDRMRQEIKENTTLQTAMSGEMKANIENMMRQSEAARQSTDELTRVFKHGTKVQGDWGETVLDELLQSQGLTRGIHYDTQSVLRDSSGQTIKPEGGSSLRPDVIMHLDQRRELIIDSKVSLTAFMDYVNAETEDARQAALAAHVASVQKHVKELSNKDYSSYIQAPKVKMDYVIMFVPHTGALWTALNAQPDMWRRAMEQNVFIADEQTLFAALRIINLTWTQITQIQQHEKVYGLAEEMLDRVGQFMKHYQSIGESLTKAQKAYDNGLKKLEPQGQSILGTANKLIKLGAKPSSKNPIPQLVDVDDVPALEEPSETSETLLTGSAL